MMQSPELLLPELNRALRELRGAASLLDDESLDAELLPVMRRLLLAEVVGNTWIVAIAGSQGAGKTTLLRTMYGLTEDDAEWLKPNEGRGEKLPILVVEHCGNTFVQGAVRYLKQASPGQFALDERDVSQTEFQKAVSGEDPEVLLPILKVPSKYFRRPGQAWLLLPGYERSNRENKVWQELMRQAVVGAAGCLIVTDRTRLANQEQVEIVRDMLSNELRCAHPIVVVSKTEAESSEGLKELQRTASEVFQLDDKAMRRQVICTGSTSPEYVTQWLPLLASALDNLSVGGADARQNQLARLEGVLSRDLVNALAKIRMRAQLFFHKEAGGSDGSQQVLNTGLEAFDEARDTLRLAFCQAAETMLSERTGMAWKGLEGRLIDNHEGWGKKLLNYFDTVTETQQRLDKDVTEAWDSQGLILGQFSNVLRHVTAQALGLDRVMPQMLAGGEIVPSEKLTYESDDTSERVPDAISPRLDAGVLRNLRLIFNPRQPGDSVESTESGLSSADFERAISTLPALGLEYALVASLFPQCVGVDPKSLMEVPQADMDASVAKFTEGATRAKTLSKTVLEALAMVLTVDVAVDGKVDIFQGIGGLGSKAAVASTGAATGAAGGAATATAMAVAQAAAGLVAVGYLLHLAMQEVRSHDKEVRAHAHRMLLNISERHLAHFTSHFNSLMDQLRVHLKRQLGHRYRLDERLMEQDRLAKALVDVRAAQRDLRDELARSGQTLQIFDRAGV